MLKVSNDLSHFSKNDPFKPLNNAGVIKEVPLGGIYKVEVTQEEEVFLKSIFSGQMVRFTTNEPGLPEADSTTKISLMNVHNFISEFGLVVRKEIYNRGLRLKRHVYLASVDSLFQGNYQVLDSSQCCVR